MINSYCPHLIQICYMMHMSVKKKNCVFEAGGSNREVE